MINSIDSPRKRTFFNIGVKATDIFYFCYSLWIADHFLQDLTLFADSIPSTFFKLIRYFALAGIIAKEILSFKFKMSSLIPTLIGYSFVSVSLFIAFQSGASYIFDVALIIFSSRDCDFNKILDIQVKIVLFLSFVTIVSSTFHLIPNRFYYQDGGRVRQSLGFSYTTFLPQLVFFTTLEIAQIKKRELRWYVYLLLLVIDVVVYRYTDTRNPFLLTFLFVIFIYFYNNLAMFRKVFRRLSWIFVPSFAIASGIAYFFSINYGRSAISLVLDKVLSGRLLLSNRAISTYGIKWFGQKIDLIGGSSMTYGNVSIFDKYNYIDSSYIQMLVLQGQAYFMLIILLLTITMIFLIRKRYFYLVIILLFVSVHSIVDPQLLMLWYSPFCLAIGFLFHSAWAQRGGTNQVQVDNKHIR